MLEKKVDRLQNGDWMMPIMYEFFSNFSNTIQLQNLTTEDACIYSEVHCAPFSMFWDTSRMINFSRSLYLLGFQKKNGIRKNMNTAGRGTCSDSSCESTW